MFGDHVRGVRLAASAAVAALVASGIAGVAQAQVVEPVVSVGTAMVMETFARGDWVQAVVPVTLDRPAAADVTVSYATADGTAQAGSRIRSDPAAITCEDPV